MVIDCFIPMAEGQELLPWVEESLSNQSISVVIRKIVRAGVVDSNRNYSRDRLIGEGLSRSAIFDEILKLNPEFYMIQDRDIVHLGNTSVERALNVLKSDNDHRVCYLPASLHPSQTHPRNGCMVGRRKFLRWNIGDSLFAMLRPNEHCYCRATHRICDRKKPYLYAAESALTREVF
jgi:hypothetical protein